MSFLKKIVDWYRQRRVFSEICEWAGILLVVFIIRTIGFGLHCVPTSSMETTILRGERLFSDKLTPLFTAYKHGDIVVLDDPTYKYSENQLLNWFQHYVLSPSWTKRVIGIPGDHVEGKIEDGRPVVYRNGQKLDESYINKYPLIALVDKTQSSPFDRKSYDPKFSYDKQPFYRMSEADTLSIPMFYPHTPTRGFREIAREGMPVGPADIFDVHLDSDEYWLMGDNRQNSLDSRFWGPLKSSFVHGRVKMCLYSIDITDSWGRLEWLHIFPFDIILHPINFWKWVRWSRCLRFIY